MTLRGKYVLGLALGFCATWLIWNARPQAEAPRVSAAERASATALHAPRVLPRKVAPTNRGANLEASEAAAGDTEIEPQSDPTTADDGVAPASTSVAAKGDQPTRVEQLRMTVLQEAVRKDWVSVTEEGAPCPPQQLRILYGAPSDLSRYTRGAYFEPLGPEPSDSTQEINGLLICEGYTHLYRGFEAFYRADRGQWDVFPFPVIE